MPAPVKVYPTKASSLNIPASATRPPLTVDGAFWPVDSFTARRLSDGSVTTDPAQAYVPSPSEPEPEPTPAAPPAG